MNICLEAVAQSVQAFGPFLSGKPGHLLRALIDFNAGNNPFMGEDVTTRRAIAFLLTDRLVIQDRTADALTETRRSYN